MATLVIEDADRVLNLKLAATLSLSTEEDSVRLQTAANAAMDRMRKLNPAWKPMYERGEPIKKQQAIALAVDPEVSIKDLEFVLSLKGMEIVYKDEQYVIKKRS